MFVSATARSWRRTCGALLRLIRNVAVSNVNGDPGSNSNTSCSNSLATSCTRLSWSFSKFDHSLELMPLRPNIVFLLTRLQSDFLASCLSPSSQAGSFCAPSVCRAGTLKRVSQLAVGKCCQNDWTTPPFQLAHLPTGLRNSKNGINRNNFQPRSSPIQCHTDGLFEPPPVCSRAPIGEQKKDCRTPVPINIIKDLPTSCIPCLFLFS